MTKRYRYSRCCVDCGGCVEDLNKMIEEARDVTYGTVLRHCRGLLDWSGRLSYASRCDQGLTLRDDPYVSYHKSHFQGRCCYYVKHSCIEYIWVEDDPDDSGIREADSIQVSEQRGDSCERGRIRSPRSHVGTLDDTLAAVTSATMSRLAGFPAPSRDERRPRSSS